MSDEWDVFNMEFTRKELETIKAALISRANDMSDLAESDPKHKKEWLREHDLAMGVWDIIDRELKAYDE